MGFLDFLKRKYVSEKQFTYNLQRQMLIYPKVLSELRNLGINEHAVMKLYFFFYTNKRSKAEQLKEKLSEKAYAVEEVRKSLSNNKWMVCGLSVPIKMDVNELSAWSKYMCEAGYTYDCFFDCWDIERDN